MKPLIMTAGRNSITSSISVRRISWEEYPFDNDTLQPSFRIAGLNRLNLIEMQNTERTPMSKGHKQSRTGGGTARWPSPHGNGNGNVHEHRRHPWWTK